MIEGGDCRLLYEEIRSYKTWAHITESTWAIVTEKKSSEIRDHLGEYLPKGSRIFVIKSGVESAWRNVKCRNKWLKKNL